MNRAPAAAFLAALFPQPPLDELINLRVITPEGAVRSIFPQDAAAVVEATTKAAPTANVYIGVNLRAEKDDSKDGVRHVYAVFGDFDSPKSLCADARGRAAFGLRPGRLRAIARWAPLGRAPSDYPDVNDPVVVE